MSSLRGWSRLYQTQNSCLRERQQATTYHPSFHHPPLCLTVKPDARLRGKGPEDRAGSDLASERLQTWCVWVTASDMGDLRWVAGSDFSVGLILCRCNKFPRCGGGANQCLCCYLVGFCCRCVVFVWFGSLCFETASHYVALDGQ